MHTNAPHNHAAAVETAIGFGLFESDVLSYSIEQISSYFAVISNDVEQIAASLCDCDAHYIAIICDDELVHIYEVGTSDDAGWPVIRGTRTAYKPDSSDLERYLRDAALETAKMRKKRDADTSDELEDLFADR